ncbi:Methyltransferase protein 2 A like [Fasciola hepatica]|uniref:tRNA N(3)-methylcytidine methyltransferase n=1 Tax=Fasciola hepatica TaxID=6192 RepID=A0A4E0RFB8_FASHE|nr:Methyltransferase protein 2 A like [Fasciola hepatica]
MDGNQESSGVHDSVDPMRPKFGQRYLKDEAEVYSHNAWDNVLWTAEQESQANAIIAENSADILPIDAKEHHDMAAAEYWDKFYAQHQDKFFKDRSWLFTEFPELFASNGKKKHFLTSCADDCKIFEVGCGVGNTTIPILRKNTSKNVFLYTSDFSSNAVELLKKSLEYDPLRCHAFTFDITKTETKLPFTKGSIDIIIMVFVLSAVSPDQYVCILPINLVFRFPAVIENLASYLKPGGLFLVRDYGRGDMVQLRFKKGKCLGENFYLRSDGTRVYFFQQDELRQLFSGFGLEEIENTLDRRLIVNRKKELKMYRVWIQCKYRKST